MTAFWMATLGGAAALDLPVGLIEVGRRFDAFAVDTTARDGARRNELQVWPELHGPQAVFEKIVRLAGPTDITHTWVNGHRTLRLSAPFRHFPVCDKNSATRSSDSLSQTQDLALRR